MGFTVLLLLKGKVQVERQFLFKEVNFKYCCQTKKRDKTGACETVVCKSLQFSSSEKLLYSLCSSQSQEWIKHYPFYTGLPDFCSTHSVLMIKHIKVCFYFSTEMGINWCRCEQRFLSKLFLHFFSPLLLADALELRWRRASCEWIRMQVMMERCVITLNGQLPLAWINERTFTVAVHRDFETLRYPERFCSTLRRCQVSWAH